MEALLLIPELLFILFELIIGSIFLNSLPTLIFIIVLILANIFSKNKTSIIYSFFFMIAAFLNSYYLKRMLPGDGPYNDGGTAGVVVMVISAIILVLLTIMIFRTVFGKEEVTESTKNVEKEKSKKRKAKKRR